MIKSVAISSEYPGRKLLVLGAIHGNEKCGTEAINRVIAEFFSGSVALERGQVTFVPMCNPRAYDRDIRFIERNLNRYLVPTENPDCYEARLGNILCPMLAECDVLLDIHSYTVGGEPFVLVGPENSDERAFAASLGTSAMLTGWVDAYAATGRGAKTAGNEESTGTTEYARRFGAIATTIECGQHKDAQSPEVAYRAIHNAMRHLGLVKADSVELVAPPLIAVTHVHYRDAGWNFPKDWKHLEPLARGEIMATGPDEKTLVAPADGFIIMPKYGADTGEEWFYFGVQKQG